MQEILSPLHPDVYDAHEEAQAGLQEAFRKEVAKKSEA
jgi:hypothetical protein